MAQSQQRITLTSTPVQITNGSNYAFIQSADGRYFSVAVGTTAPTVDNTWQQVKEISIAPPFMLWACSQSGSTVDIKVSTAS
ncbi:hypothetical protein ACLDXX_04775 [Acinetobacter baumannii]